MKIYSRLQLFAILMPAMASALRIPLPASPFSLAVLDLQSRIRSGGDTEAIARTLYAEANGVLSKAQALVITRMGKTLWSIIKHVDLPERRYDV